MCTYQGMDCREVRFGFTPFSEPGKSMVWLLRLIGDGQWLVVRQTIADVPKGEVEADLPLLRHIHARLVNSIDLA